MTERAKVRDIMKLIKKGKEEVSKQTIQSDHSETPRQRNTAIC